MTTTLFSISNLSLNTTGIFLREVPQAAPVSRTNRHIASVLFGWVLGFLWLTGLTAYRQYSRVNVYITLCWLEMLSSFLVALLEWLDALALIPHGLPLITVGLIVWSLQLQFLFQILVNRICLLVNSKRQKILLKSSVAVVVSMVNIVIIVLGLPILGGFGGESWIKVAKVFYHIDRGEKILMLLLDGLLNWMFIWVVKKSLVDAGLRRYEDLIKFNMRIIVMSLLMDVVVIGFISYPEPHVYQMIQAVAYLIKLQIEMTMSDLIIRVARDVKDYDSETTLQGQSSGDQRTQFTESAVVFAPRMSGSQWTNFSLRSFLKTKDQTATNRVSIPPLQSVPEAVYEGGRENGNEQSTTSLASSRKTVTSTSGDGDPSTQKAKDITVVDDGDTNGVSDRQDPSN